MINWVPSTSIKELMHSTGLLTVKEFRDLHLLCKMGLSILVIGKPHQDLIYLGVFLRTKEKGRASRSGQTAPSMKVIGRVIRRTEREDSFILTVMCTKEIG